VTLTQVAAPPQPPIPARVRTVLTVGAAAVAAAVAIATTWLPLLVLPAAAGLALVIAAVIRLDLALILLAAAVPLEYSVELGGNPQLTLVKLAGGLCFVSFIVQLAARRKKLRLDSTHLMLLGILACILVSTVAAQSLDTALLVAVRYISYVGLFVVLTAFAGDYRTLERIVWVLSIACAVAGALAIRNLLVGFDTRATPTYGDANDLAYILSTTLPLTLWLLRRRGLQRVFVLGLVAVISIADVLTFSRGAAFGLGCAVVWLAFTRRHQLRTALVPLTLVAILVGVVAVAQPARLGTALTNKTAVAGLNISHRLDAWRSAVELIAAHPLVGVAPGNFQFYSAAVDGRPPTDADPTVVHNTYLDIGAEVGLPALALLLAFLLTSLTRLRAVLRQQVGPPSFAVAVTAAMIVAIMSALTLSEQYYAPLWLLGAIVTCMWQEMKAKPTLAPVEPSR
jgi:putative inorganic carbon (hco3(-)) transporter